MGAGATQSVTEVIKELPRWEGDGFKDQYILSFSFFMLSLLRRR